MDVRLAFFDVEESQRYFVDLSTTKSICGWLMTKRRIDQVLVIKVT